MKANHNASGLDAGGEDAVSSTAKVVKWKQITTKISGYEKKWMLFPVRQR